MIEITLSPESSRRLLKFQRTAAQEIDRAVKNSITQSGQFAQRAVQHFAPRKTGTLKGSIQVDGQGTNKVTVGTNKEYARIHEYGGTFTRNKAWGKPTRPYKVTYIKFRGRGYFAPGFRLTTIYARKKLNENINKTLNDLSK